MSECPTPKNLDELNRATHELSRVIDRRHDALNKWAALKTHHAPQDKIQRALDILHAIDKRKEELLKRVRELDTKAATDQQRWSIAQQLTQPPPGGKGA